MSIIASVKVCDGIVLGSDSATQIMGRDPQGNIGVLKVYENAKKLFKYNEYPIGILTHGIGNIEKKSIETLLLEFERNKSSKIEEPHLENFSQDLFNFFQDKYNHSFNQLPNEKKPVLGFFIAGYSPSSPLAEEWEFLLPRDEKPKLVRPLDQFGASWRGISIPFTRLYFGFDPRVKNKLKQLGVSDNIIEDVFNEFKAKVVYDGMPVQDAVKFVEYILKTTIELAYFEIGPKSCSEPISIAVIDLKRNFKWIRENILHL